MFFSNRKMNKMDLWNEKKAKNILNAMDGTTASSSNAHMKAKFLPEIQSGSPSSFPNGRQQRKKGKGKSKEKKEKGSRAVLHPSWVCRRVGCPGFLTLLGADVKNHIDDLTESRKRAFAKRTDFPNTYLHGSILTCDLCGDRPKPANGGRRAAWQRLCTVCGEPYAMNGFWRKHGGLNHKGECIPLERRSHVHHQNMRKHFRTIKDVNCLSDKLEREKKWLALAVTGKIDQTTHSISDASIEKFSMPYMEKLTKADALSHLTVRATSDKVKRKKRSKTSKLFHRLHAAVGKFEDGTSSKHFPRKTHSFQISSSEQLLSLRPDANGRYADIDARSSNIGTRRKRTTMKRPKRSRSDLEAHGYDDKIDGHRGRHGPEKRLDRNRLKVSSSKRKAKTHHKMRNERQRDPAESTTADVHALRDVNILRRVHPNQRDELKGAHSFDNGVSGGSILSVSDFSDVMKSLEGPRDSRLSSGMSVSNANSIGSIDSFLRQVPSFGNESSAHAISNANSVASVDDVSKTAYPSIANIPSVDMIPSLGSLDGSKGLGHSTVYAGHTQQRSTGSLDGIVMNINLEQRSSYEKFPSVASISHDLDDVVITPRLVRDLSEPSSGAEC